MTHKSSDSTSILVLGAGELGIAMVNAFLKHPSYTTSEGEVKFTVLVRPLQPDSTPEKSAKAALLDDFRSRGVEIEFGDLENSSQADLSSVFQKYATVIDAGGMARSPGTQLKITKAALDASVDTYVPWHFGVDYDTIGPEGGGGLFKEQCEVRVLLRAQNRTKWLFIPCGIFMSFLFDPIWGVVKRDDHGQIEGISALGKWDDLITATTVEDIAHCTAQLILVDTSMRNMTVWLAGDSMTYAEFADMLDRVSGKNLKREIRTVPELREVAEKHSDVKLNKYYLVFAEANGIAWKKPTYDQQIGLKTTSMEEWLRGQLATSAG